MTICTVGKVVISNKIHFDQVSKIRQKHYDLNTVSIVVNKMGNKIRTEKRKGKIRESRCLLIIIICNPLEGVGSSSAQWGQNILKPNSNFSLILTYNVISCFKVSILIRLKNKNNIGEVWWNFWECGNSNLIFQNYMAPLWSGIAFYNVDGWSISKSNRVAGDNC